MGDDGEGGHGHLLVLAWLCNPLAPAAARAGTFGNVGPSWSTDKLPGYHPSMNSTRALLAVAAALLLGMLLVPGGAPAQFTPQPRESYLVFPPDGGFRVIGTVEARAPDGGYEVTVVNTVGAIVRIDGLIDPNPFPVFLPAATVNLLAGDRECTYTPVGRLEVGANVVSVAKVTGQTGATLTVHNFGPTVDYVSCWPTGMDGGPAPNCDAGTDGVGYDVHERGSQTFDLTDLLQLKCVSCNYQGTPIAHTAWVSGGITVCLPPQ